MDEDDIDFLLAKGALSGRQREVALERILDRVAPRKRATRRQWVGLALVAAAGLATFLAWRPRTKSAGVEFAARGAPTANARVEIVCVGGNLEACPRGAHLLFAASGGAEPGYLTAYAQPIGGGERVWYFSSEHETPRIAPGGGATAPLDGSVQIGAEHGAGRYLVHVFVGSRPLSREDVLRLPPGDLLLAETLEVDIVK